MPTIPTYGGPQVREQALGAPMMGTPDVSSGARALGQALGTAADVVDKHIERQAQIDAFDTQAAIAEDFTRWQAEARKVSQGANAKGFTGQVTEWWEKVKQERFSKLTPEAQRVAARALATARLSALASASDYENQQLDIAEKQGLTSATATLSSQAIAAGPDKGAPILAAVVDQIRKFGARKGVDVEAEVIKAQTYVHSNIIGQLARDNPDRAKEYFTGVKGEIDAARHDEIAKTLQTASLSRTAQTFADDVMGKSLSLQDALAAARAKFSGDEETAAIAEIKTRYQEAEVVKDRIRRDTTRQAWSSLMQTGNITRIDPTLMRNLREQAPEEERQMRDWLDAKRRQAKAEAEGNPNPDEFGRFYTYFRMATEAPAKFADLDLTKVQPYVSKQQLGTLVSMQASVNKGEAKAMESQRQIRQTLTMLDSSIRAAGLNPRAKPDSKQAKEYDNFMGAVTQSLAEAQAAQPDKPLTPDQMRQVGMRMLQEGYEQGSGIFGFFQTKKRGYQIATDPELAGKDFVSTPFEKIPPAIRKELERAYDAKNKPSSIYGNAAERAAAIERAYQRGVEEGRFR